MNFKVLFKEQILERNLEYMWTHYATAHQRRI